MKRSRDLLANKARTTVSFFVLSIKLLMVLQQSDLVESPTAIVLILDSVESKASDADTSPIPFGHPSPAHSIAHRAPKYLQHESEREGPMLEHCKAMVRVEQARLRYGVHVMQNTQGTISCVRGFLGLFERKDSSGRLEPLQGL